MTRIRIALLSAQIALLVSIMRLADALHHRVMGYASTTYINALACRNVARDYAERHDPRGCLGDELVGCVAIIGMIAMLSLIAIDTLGDLPAATAMTASAHP